jgi:hypothetical protein
MKNRDSRKVTGFFVHLKTFLQLRKLYNKKMDLVSVNDEKDVEISSCVFAVLFQHLSKETE